MKSSYFRFTKAQRLGILILFGLIVALQLIYFFVNFRLDTVVDPDEEEWLVLQTKIDSLKSIETNRKPKMYPFNPNFISDYKGYLLGMSVAEIDRLFEFRKQNKYVNSAQEFQNVTKVSDSLLKTIAPYFKFPDWVTNKVSYKREQQNFTSKIEYSQTKTHIIKDINQATREDLMRIYGIGEALSTRILSQKEIFGGFVSMEQLKDVWGLSPEIIANLNQNFRVVIPSDLKKIAINDASLKELSQFPYFKYSLAKEIIVYRSMNGDFKNIEGLLNIKGFPVDKTKIIDLYLKF